MSGILGKLFSSGAGQLVESVGGVIDNLHTSKAEKLEAKQKMQELISKHEAEMEKNITDRWTADMNSDSWLSKNVRPMVLIFLMHCYLGVCMGDYPRIKLLHLLVNLQLVRRSFLWVL